jgi:hypothetical protein
MNRKLVSQPAISKRLPDQRGQLWNYLTLALLKYNHFLRIPCFTFVWMCESRKLELANPLYRFMGEDGGT